MKELQVARAAGAMDFNGDDDEPPPLELESGSSRSEQGDNQAEEDTSLMDEMVAVAQRAKEETRRRQEKERNSRTFGHGLKKGFFNTKPRVVDAAGGGAKTAVPKTTSGRDKKMPTREDLLIVKQQAKEAKDTKTSSDSRFVFPEVQSALESMNQLDPKAWMNAKFFEKLAHNPRLALALQNPRFTHAIDEMQRDPEAAIRKYRDDAAVSAMLQDFLGFLGNHFEELGKEQEAANTKQQQQEQEDNQTSSGQEGNKAALLVQQPRAQPASASLSAPAGIVDLDETRRAAIANMERSPEEDAQVQKILQSPELLQALSDAELMARLQRCRESPLELRRLQSDPSLAPKLRLLVDAGFVRFE